MTATRGIDPENNAVRIATRGQGGSASLVPTVDLIAAKERIEELENASLALFLQERLARNDSKRLSAGDFLTGIGMGEFVDNSLEAEHRVEALAETPAT